MGTRVFSLCTPASLLAVARVPLIAVEVLEYSDYAVHGCSAGARTNTTPLAWRP